MIDILLATYNGEKYIDTQISSIVNQSYSDWKLYIHDDGSSDSTIEKIKLWTSRDSRIAFIEDGMTFHNPGMHFMHLLKFSKSELVCFSDQDDLWLEYKLQRMFEAFDRQRKNPYLLVSNCYLWNIENKTIIPKVNFNQAYSLEEFLFLNGGLQGCAMMFNSELRNIALSRNVENLYMHDYLISLIAFTFGKVKYLSENLFLYRQYENNVSVHIEINKNQYRKRILKNRKIPVVFAPAYKNIMSFYQIFKNEIDESKKKVFKRYLELKDKNSIARFFRVFFSKFSLGKNGHKKLVLKMILRKFWRES